MREAFTIDHLHADRIELLEQRHDQQQRARPRAVRGNGPRTGSTGRLATSSAIAAARAPSGRRARARAPAARPDSQLAHQRSRAGRSSASSSPGEQRRRDRLYTPTIDTPRISGQHRVAREFAAAARTAATSGRFSTAASRCRRTCSRPAPRTARAVLDEQRPGLEPHRIERGEQDRRGRHCPGCRASAAAPARPPVSALFAPSGAATPSMTPVPNSSGCFETAFSMP